MSIIQYQLVATEQFKSRYKKLIKKDKMLNKRIAKTLSFLETNPYHPSLKTHKVQDVKSSWVTGDIRIIWIFSNEEIKVIDLLDLGGHGDVYRF
jgi:mRNA-degrading endonuclease YafQ of YafQ-DinJ toxin-antitoxin module